jgi:hypothetical protein
MHKVGNGGQTKLWKDVWLDDVPLSVSYHDIFVVSSARDALVKEMEENGVWIV